MTRQQWINENKRNENYTTQQ